MASKRIARGPGIARFGPVGDWTPELGEAFIALVEENGNYRASARALGHPFLFTNRMRRHPGFRRRCEAAARAADARLRLAESPFPPPIQTKSMPPADDGRPPRGTKRPANHEPVIRRAASGRLQISHVPEGGWTSAIEADFLELLRNSGNFEWSASAVGFTPGAVYKRRDEWPAFARDCRAALEEADIRLEYRLVAHAHALLRRGIVTRDSPHSEDCPPLDEVPFDPEAAMRIIGFLDRRKAGRAGGRSKGAPERSFDEVQESILGKLRAIERHEAMFGKKEDDEPPEEEGNGDGG